MKILYLLPLVLLAACSSEMSEQSLPESKPTVTVVGEQIPTTSRYFSFVPTPSILIFSETRDWRHEEGIAGANLAIMKAAKEMGHGYYTTEHSGIFNEKDLARFDVGEFIATHEWYTFEAPPSDDFIVLAGLDESTYSPVNNAYGDRSDLRMGPKTSDHPIIWARCLGDNQARTVFTAMGHRYETYETTEALLILKNMLNWAAKKTDPESSGCAK